MRKTVLFIVAAFACITGAAQTYNTGATSRLEVIRAAVEVDQQESDRIVLAINKWQSAVNIARKNYPKDEAKVKVDEAKDVLSAEIAAILGPERQAKYEAYEKEQALLKVTPSTLKRLDPIKEIVPDLTEDQEKGLVRAINLVQKSTSEAKKNGDDAASRAIKATYESTVISIIGEENFRAVKAAEKARNSKK